MKASLPTDAHLRATPAIDFDHPEVAAFAREFEQGFDTQRERAVAIYYAVRDRIRYDPYRIDATLEGLRASTPLQQGHGFCMNKAVLLAAACRANGIPARLGFADVRNHLSTERLRESMKTDVFYYHGYTALWIEEKWVKATPAFNLSLCEKFGLLPLEFDGLDDSIIHPFDRDGNRHMEYLHFHGERDDLPLEEIQDMFRLRYPGFAGLGAADFEADVENEGPSA